MNISQLSTPIRKSQASARSVEPPYTPPLIRQIVGTARSSSRLTTSSNADPAVCSCALAARSAIEPRSYPELKARPVPVNTNTRIAESPSIRSNSFTSASRSSGCRRFKCFGRLRRTVARAPTTSSSGTLGASLPRDCISCSPARAAWLRRRWSRQDRGAGPSACGSPRDRAPIAGTRVLW